MPDKANVALVTGGLRGIGRAIAERLAEAGFRVAVCDIAAPDTLGDQADALKSSGIAYFQCDVSKPEARAQLFSDVLARFGRLDALVNNAGIAPRVRADVLDTDEGSFDLLMAVNLKGPYFLSQLAAKQMLTQPCEDHYRGVIVNIESCSADVISINRGEYCVSKAGIAMATQLFAARLADEGILVYGVRPGIIATDMTAGVKEKYDALFAQGITPMTRWGQADDVAEAVCLLCEGRLRYSTGEIINVDGGLHIKRL